MSKFETTEVLLNKLSNKSFGLMAVTLSFEGGKDVWNVEFKGSPAILGALSGVLQTRFEEHLESLVTEG